MGKQDSDYLSRREEFRHVKLLTGHSLNMDVRSIVGYCHSDIHKGIVTIYLMNEHHCTEKECFYFEKFPDYPYWKKRDITERQNAAIKKKQKRRREAKRRQQEESDRIDQNLQQRAEQIAKELGITNFRITSIRRGEKETVIFYISHKNINDWYDFREIAFAMNREFPNKFVLRHVKNADGSYATY